MASLSVGSFNIVHEAPPPHPLIHYPTRRSLLNSYLDFFMDYHISPSKQQRNIVQLGTAPPFVLEFYAANWLGWVRGGGQRIKPDR